MYVHIWKSKKTCICLKIHMIFTQYIRTFGNTTVIVECIQTPQMPANVFIYVKFV